MKITNELFFKAKKDIGLKSMIIVQTKENDIMRAFIRLVVEQKNKYDRNLPTETRIDTDTEITVENYSQLFGIGPRRAIKSISFHCAISSWNHQNHMRTFLSKIKPKSDVRFLVTAFNTCENYNAISWTSHQLYGIIGNDCFFLADYTGPDNTATPVK